MDLVPFSSRRCVRLTFALVLGILLVPALIGLNSWTLGGQARSELPLWMLRGAATIGVPNAMVSLVVTWFASTSEASGGRRSLRSWVIAVLAIGFVVVLLIRLLPGV
ncbi:MAG: hypothetical protein Q8P50_14335 [Bacillota bacterium]|nr:hypothetical protein [Bacillota bacterium]